LARIVADHYLRTKFSLEGTLAVRVIIKERVKAHSSTTTA
jgi:hypothetical protein